MLYNRLLENLILPAGDIVLGSSYINQLKKWRAISGLSEPDIRSLQRKNLNLLLAHANENVPYYRDLKIPSLDDPFHWVSQFPILTKKIIKENIERLVLGDKNKLIKEASSGSSGIQGVVYLTKGEHSISQAIQTLWWEWAGYKFGNSLIQTGISPNRGTVKRVKDVLLRTDYIPAFGISEEQILNKLKQLARSPRDHFGGYASSIFLFAKVAKDHGINDVRFKSVISWGDKMFPHFRTLIEDQFKTKVFDTYGCTEGIMISAQKDIPEYYVMSPHVYLELLDENDNPVNPGELGRVVVTRLDAFAMPLIRYYLGDLAIMAEPGGNAQLGFPRLLKIIGRDTDIVKTRNNRFMVVHSFTGIFEHIPEVKQFRVIQRNIEGIEIEIIPDLGFNNNITDRIQQRIHEAVNDSDFRVSFRLVDNIPPTPSGKPQIIQSFLSN